jgi:NADPH:quinone reductase-like Zn-dependent oxidoreductase
MKAVCVDHKAPGHLTIGEAPEPQPDSHQAIVRVQAVSLNRGELRRAEGGEAGMRIGWDLAGTIDQAAADGSGPPAGTRVVGFSKAMRGWAERCAVPTRELAPIPDGVSLEDAATLPVAGLTALYGLERGERLLASPVLVTGASGGTGLFAVTLAARMGARVVAHVRRADQEALVREAGAHEVVVHPEGEGVERHGPYRLILDGVGGALLTRLMPLLMEDGRCVIYGVTAGPEAALAIRPLMVTGRGRVEGFFLYREAEVEPASRGLARLLALLADGRLRTRIEVHEDWSQVGPVAERLIGRKFSGKAVLTLGG